MSNNDFNNINLKLPDIASGKIIPYSMQEKIIKQEQEEKIRKEQHRHDYIVVAVSAIISAIISNIDRIVAFISEIKF